MFTFIYLSAFASQGGIERFNRAFICALSQNFNKVAFHSVYDNKKDIDKRYLIQGDFIGFQFSKIWTIIKITVSALFKKSNVIIIAHLNLAPIALIIKFFRPKQKMVLIAHGIDVWNQTNYFKVKFLNKVDKIWAVSNYTKSKIVAQYNISNDKIEIFPNTLDPFFDANSESIEVSELKKRYDINENKKIILTLCRISAHEGYKGYDRVVEALAQIDSSNIIYLIAGKYDLVEKRRIEVLAKKMKVDNCIRFTSFIDEKEIVAHYKLANLFIMPSFNEGFGIVFLEAMACGIPVIAGNIDGSVDALKNGELGSLINPNDINEIAREINKQLVINKEHNEGEKLSNKAYEIFGFQKFKELQSQLLNKM